MSCSAANGGASGGSTLLLTGNFSACFLSADAALWILPSAAVTFLRVSSESIRQSVFKSLRSALRQSSSAAMRMILTVGSLAVLAVSSVGSPAPDIRFHLLSIGMVEYRPEGGRNE